MAQNFPRKDKRVASQVRSPISDLRSLLQLSARSKLMVSKFFTERQEIPERPWFFCCMDSRVRRSCFAS
jgi:hypothetical protein